MSRAAVLVGRIVLPVRRDIHVHRRTPSAGHTGRDRSGAGTRDTEPTPCQEAIPALGVRRRSIRHHPRCAVRWRGPRGPAAQPRPTSSSSTLSPTGLRPSVGIWPAESRVVPERWAGAREPLPAPASDMAAAALPVHCRRAARPPSLHPIGPEGASLSALSLPDSRPTLARAGVLLAAAASRRPPARHRPLPGTDKTGRRRNRRRSRHCRR